MGNSVVATDQRLDNVYDGALGLTHADASDLELQYEALEALCESYNSRVELSTMRFYPKGGSLYRLFWMRDQLKQHGKVVDIMPECFQTGDVDGILLVMPRGITNVRLLDYIKSTVVRNDAKEYLYSHIDIQRDIYDIAEEAYAKVLNKRNAASWLKTLSTKKYSLSLPKDTFVPSRTKSLSTALSTFDFYPVFDTSFFDPAFDARMTDENMYLEMTYRGKSEKLDVHFGFLEPSAKSESSLEVMEVVLNATPLSSSIYVMPQKHFFVDQLRLMFERVNAYFSDAVFDKKKDVKQRSLTKALEGRGALAVGRVQSVLKAGKTLCRVQELSSSFEHLTLEDLFEWHQGLFSNKQPLQSTRLKKYVKNFNTSMFGRHNQLLDSSMSVGQVISVVKHLFNNTKHIGTASIEMSRRKSMFAQCVQNTLQYKQMLCADIRF